MNRLTDYTLIQQNLQRLKELKKGLVTNFYLTPDRVKFLIEKELLFYRNAIESFFILLRDHNFYHLYYYVTSLNSLNEGLDPVMEEVGRPIVVDIIGTKEQTVPVENLFIKKGFKNYTNLNRMSRLNNIKEVCSLNANVRYGETKDIESVHEFLHIYFDPYSEQLPMIDEIENWVRRGELLVYEDNDIVSGFILFDIIGVTSYLRYWFVHPNYRNRKVGSALLNRYFYESRNTKRQLFWVIESNINAIIRYKHYGFQEENLFDRILIINQQLHE